jgi:TRAP-type transport system small permease protein
MMSQPIQAGTPAESAVAAPQAGAAAALYGRFASAVASLTNAALVLIIAVMCLLVLAQVITRYVTEDTPPFLSELATYCLIWTACLGSSIAFRHRKHVAMELLHGRSKALDFALNWINIVALVLFLCVFFYSSLAFALDMWEQHSATMDFSMTYPAAGVPLGTALMVIQVIDAFLHPEL